MLSDKPSPDSDLLTFSRYVEPLVEVITSDQLDTPFVLGIYGEWGSGKTTLMQMIQQRVELKEFPNLFFVPWLYEQEENLIIPLLEALHDLQLGSSADVLKAEAGIAATVMGELFASFVLGTLSQGKVSYQDAEESADKAIERRIGAISEVRRRGEKLQKVVDELTDDGRGGRLVIFIDDLDRCTPVQIIGLLEDIKLFLNLKHTVVLIAMDRDIILRGIQVYYRDFLLPDDELPIVAADYLDKIVQLPFHLFPIGPEQVGDYIAKLPISSHVAQQVELFKRCLLPIPRKIKRALNSYDFAATIVDTDPVLDAIIDKDILAKVVIIQQQWNSLYRESASHPRLMEALEKVYKGTLALFDDRGWDSFEKAEELMGLCRRYHRPSTQLEALFLRGASFEGRELRPYLSMLG